MNYVRETISADTAAAIRKLGEHVQKAHAEAMRVASQVIVDEANTLAPGPHVVAERVNRTVEGIEVVNVGPDKPHWYYKFFETGVQPFEMNLITGSVGRTRGKGRPLHSAKRAFKFTGSQGDVFASVIHRGSMAARPFARTAADRKQRDMQAAFEKSLQAALKAIEQ